MTEPCVDPRLIAVLGPTASGKTRLAVALAMEFAGEIISADSRQVFRGMDIGSGKDLHEYGQVPYHLIDILDAGSEFSVFDFQRRFLKARAEISERGAVPIICGGSGMYLDAALRGYRMVEVPYDEALRARLAMKTDSELVEELQRLKPDQHNSTDILDRERTVRAIEIARGEAENRLACEPLPSLQSSVLGIHWEREALRERITVRLRDRLDNGMVEEVQRLYDSGIAWERLDYYGLEYRYVGAYLRGDMKKNDMFQRLNSAIHNFAKRQGNWFRRMERHGITINWIEGGGDQLAQARKIIQNKFKS
ncbi:MAG: tRNA (adenosine(37)-N6)-dimethylallyltransferase MiaA [Geobacteraceae bacterium]|nr:tRNA (adenosine(37)-N6)-dimethylallyltransferase MiaA [Geobacteraceae bacterium]NTW78796.1 tRNA (adenosine(37)-N6)-dimethylallyltransferase MiaA [Geobacteraceae bacterium]